MRESTRRVLIEFAAAHRAAEPNASIMCGRASAEEVDGCVSRMRRVGRAKARLMTLMERADGRSGPLRDFFAANADQGCLRCWASGNRSRNHPECNAKIARWFAARTALIEFAEMLRDEEPVTSV